MGDDFLRLVSQSNPASRQYQPANHGYSPSVPYPDQSPQLLDPFFDDEEENIPDSAFGLAMPMRSQESGLPLARSAAQMAGAGPSESTFGNSGTQGWDLDEDDLQSSKGPSFNGSASFPGPGKDQQLKTSVKRRWNIKWPWEKEKQLIGERIIALNNSAANANFGWNSISTSKYNLATFVLKFLFGMCYIDSFEWLVHSY